MSRVGIGFRASATLKSASIPLFPKYRRGLQLQKPHPLKIIIVDFTFVLMFCFSGRRIIAEKKKEIYDDEQRVNKFDRGWSSDCDLFLKIGHVLNILKVLFLLCRPATLPSFFSTSMLFLELHQPVCLLPGRI